MTAFDRVRRAFEHCAYDILADLKAHLLPIFARFVIGGDRDSATA